MSSRRGDIGRVVHKVLRVLLGLMARMVLLVKTELLDHPGRLVLKVLPD
jgi:hypothetical protein